MKSRIGKTVLILITGALVALLSSCAQKAPEASGPPPTAARPGEMPGSPGAYAPARTAPTAPPGSMPGSPNATR